MQQYNIRLSVVVLMFNPEVQTNLWVGVVNKDGLYQLPSIRWSNGCDFTSLTLNLLNQYLSVDKSWLYPELLTVLQDADTVEIVYRVYIPDNIKNINLEWISHDRLEFVSQRFVRHHLKALRTALHRN